MIALVAGSVVLAILTVTADTHAEDRPGGQAPRLQVSFRGPSLAVPWGKAEAREPLSDRHSLMLSGQLDLGIRVHPQWYVGTYAGIRFGGLREPDQCAHADCGSRELRFGLEVDYHLPLSGTVVPWFGVAFGYERSQVNYDYKSERTEMNSASGYEVAALAGIGFLVAGGPLSIGPYVSFSGGRYLHAETSINDQTTFDGSIENQATHGWVELGLRLAY